MIEHESDGQLTDLTWLPGAHRTHTVPAYIHGTYIPQATVGAQSHAQGAAGGEGRVVRWKGSCGS